LKDSILKSRTNNTADANEKKEEEKKDVEKEEKGIHKNLSSKISTSSC